MRTHTEINLLMSQKGYDRFKTMDEKLLSRSIHWCCDNCGTSSILNFWQVNFGKEKKMLKQKYIAAQLDASR